MERVPKIRGMSDEELETRGDQLCSVCAVGERCQLLYFAARQKGITIMDLTK